MLCELTYMWNLRNRITKLTDPENQRETGDCPRRGGVAKWERESRGINFHYLMNKSELRRGPQRPRHNYSSRDVPRQLHAPRYWGETTTPVVPRAPPASDWLRGARRRWPMAAGRGKNEGIPEYFLYSYWVPLVEGWFHSYAWVLWGTLIHN